MYKSSLLIAVCVLLCMVCANAQSAFWLGKDAYLGQTPPSDTPRIFGQGILTQDSTFPFCRVAFSPDGKQFFYNSNTAWFSDKNQKLNSFVFKDNHWDGPVVLWDQLSAPTFSIDGSAIYLTGRKPGVVWQSKQTTAGWSEPAPFLERSYTLYNFMPTRSGKRYVGTNGTWGNRNDYESWKFGVLAEGNDTAVTSLGEPLNKPGFNGDFYIAPDESYMIVSTNETKTFECELYISFLKPDKTWTVPVTLGPLVNEGLAHRFGQYVSPDGKYLFYTKGTSEKDCNIYWMRFDNLMKQLKKQAMDKK